MSSFVLAEGDYYVALGVDSTVGTAEVNAAFRRLARRWHPDHNPAPDATRQFQYINEARQALADPARRAAYDARRAPPRQAHRRTSPAPLHPRSHRSLHRRHRGRSFLLTMVALILTISGWTSVVAAVSYRHYTNSGYDLDTSRSFQEGTWKQSRFSSEMLPVSQICDPCLRSMEWEIDLRNSWDGSIRALAAPTEQVQRPGEVPDVSPHGYEFPPVISSVEQL